MVQLTPDQLKRLIRKTSNREIITLICECLLNVVNGNVPVKIANIESFETAYKYLITPKTSVVKKRANKLSKEGFHLKRQILFIFVTSTSKLNKTAEEFILISKHLYAKEQSHAARVLNDNTIKHKNAQLSYLNQLRTQLLPRTSETAATKETFTENAAEPQQKQLVLLITDNEEVKVEPDKDEIIEEKNDSQTESILEQLQF